MKKFLILFVVLLSASLFAQPNWTNVKETNINVVSASSTDIFTNRDGNHIIVQEGISLKYYRMNINGYSDPAIFPKTIESSAVSSPSISGDADNIYIIYGVGNSVRTKRSTDKGISWSTITNHNYPSAISGTESVFSNGNLHITYQRDNKIWYRYRNQAGSWIDEQEVSINENGVNPRITARHTGTNNDYVYFLWQKSSTHEFKHRRYEVTQNNWGSPLPGYTVSTQGLISSKPAGIRVTGSTLIVYYAYEAYINNNYWYYFNWAWRNINDNTELGAGYPNLNQTQKVYTTTTFDNESHTAFYYQMIAGQGDEGSNESPWSIRHSKQTSGYPDDIVYEYEDYQYNEPTHVNVSSACNEVHIIWKDDYGNNNGTNLRYKYDDQTPLAPQNLTVSVYTVPDAQYPKLNWNLNNEPDVRINDDGYLIERRIRIAQGSWSSWTQIAYSDGSSSTFIDYGIGTAGDGFNDAEYRIRAKDMNNNTSEYSSIVQIEYGHQGMEKKNIGTTTSIDYILDQNYPNPFNPSTKISYSIKEEGLVTLKVYDVLGKEIVTLVNENKPAGNYEVEFNASLLPSGMYIYKIQSGQFSDVKKMLLTK